MDELAKAYVRIIPTTSGITDALTKELSGSAMSAAGVAAGNLIASGIMSALEGLGSLISDVITAGSGFEAAMSEVKAISGATGEEFDALKAKAEEMGASTKFTASESAAAFKYMAMAGWEAEDMINGIEGVMNLAAASGEDLAMVSDIVTDALTAFGLASEDSTHFADVLAATAANANTNVGLMGETFKYVAPVAGAMGYSIEDTALAIGLMANSAVKGSMAGTSLRSVLTRMADPTKQTQAAMDALGVSLTDSEGNMLSLGEVITNLRSGFEGGGMDADEFAASMADLQEQYDAGTLDAAEYEEEVDKLAIAMYGVEAAQKAAFAADLAGKYGMAGLLSIVSASTEDVNKLSDAIGEADGAAKEMADTMLDNLSGDITIFQSAVEGAEIALADMLMPTMREFVQEGQRGVSDFTKTLKEEGTGPAMEELGEFAAHMVTMFLEKVPEMVMAGGSLLGGLVTGFIEGAPDLLNGAIDLVLDMVDALTNPDTLVWIVEAALKLVVTLAEGLIRAIPEIIRKIPEIIAAIVEAIVRLAPELAAAALELIVQLGLSLVELIPELLTFVAKIPTAIIGGLLQGISAIGEVGEKIITGLWEGITKAWKWFIDSVKSLFTGFIDWVGSLFGGLFGDIFGVGGLPSYIDVPTDGYKYDPYTGGSVPVGVSNYYVTIPADDVDEFTDVMRISRDGTRLQRMGATG